MNRQLDRQAYVEQDGEMVNARIARVPKQTLNKDEDSVQQEEMPVEWSPEGLAGPLNEEARQELLRLQAIEQLRLASQADLPRAREHDQRNGWEGAVCSVGLVRARRHLTGKAAAYNQRRLCWLTEARPVHFQRPKRTWRGRN